MALRKSYATGKRAKAKIKPGTEVLWLGLSVRGLMIGIRRSSGSKDGMTSTPDLFWNEMYLINGTKVIVDNKENGNERKN